MASAGNVTSLLKAEGLAGETAVRDWGAGRGALDGRAIWRKNN